MEKAIDLNSSLTLIQLENSWYYRNIVFNLDQFIILSIDNKEVNIDKECLIIYNPYQINLKEKKLVNALYKKIETSLNEEKRMMLMDIESKSIELLESISDDLNVGIDYNDNIDISKLLSSFDLSFKEPDTTNYLEVLISYFKINIELFKTKFIITYGLSFLLSNEETATLEHELSILGINLIDFCFIKNNLNQSLIIDDDWCII
jgi:CRISPR type II-A-associated protein Csn2